MVNKYGTYTEGSLISYVIKVKQIVLDGTVWRWNPHGSLMLHYIAFN